MRYVIIAAIIFTSITSYAGDLAYLPNTAGGQIVLQDTKCASNKNTYSMYATDGKGAYIFGCWIFPKDSENIIVKFNDGTYSMYPPSALVFTEYGKAFYESGKHL